MKINLIKVIVAILILVTHERLAWSQGFMNLDFENPILPLTPSGGQLPTADAIPGWSAYYGGLSGAEPYIAYNGVSLGGSMVSLDDANASSGRPTGISLLPIQGNYSIYLVGSSVSTPTAASIGQTGTIPAGTQSLTFWGNLTGLQVSFNGQPIDYLVTGSTANYNIYAADISTYAGQTGQLLFTTPVNASALLDNIQFSSSPVPEPSAFALTALGILLLGFRRRRK